MKPQVLPENILRRMSKADRAPMGKAGMTKPEVQAKVDLKLEGELHKEINGWLTIQNIFAAHSRYGVKTTVPPGTPDFIFCVLLRTGRFSYGLEDPAKVRPIAMEVKVGKNTLSEDQEKVRDKMIANGWEYYTVYSLAEVVKIVKGES